MADRTHIAWTDATWNPIRGCSRVSAGCENCYAERIAHRFSGPGQPYEGLVRMTVKGARWNGTTKTVPGTLEQPLRWRRSRMIFVNSMSDLFHESLSDQDIDRVFARMAFAGQHTFQVLTKRPDRMRRYIHRLARDYDRLERAALHGGLTLRGIPLVPWPIRNVWLGTSVENQETADRRVPLLLEMPAAVRFVSYEPALESVDLRGLRGGTDSKSIPSCLDWVIIGGESGPQARPFDIAWARETIRTCAHAKIPVFVKQLGSRPIINGSAIRLRHRSGADPSEWPFDVRVQEFPLPR
jgi:protein gp37